MEIEKTEIEKILEYLEDNLRGHPAIDGILAGIFIAEDFTKMEKVIGLMKQARALMNERRLKKEEEIIVYEEMIQKLYQVHKKDQDTSKGEPDAPVQLRISKPKKREIKAQKLQEEEKAPGLSTDASIGLRREGLKISCHTNPSNYPVQTTQLEPRQLSLYKPVEKKPEKPSLYEDAKEEISKVINKSDENSIVKSFTILWSWEQVMNFIKKMYLTEK